MNCPYKPSLTCAGMPELADEGRCIGCPAGRASGRPAASGDLPLSPPLAALRRQLRERLEAEKATSPRNLTQGNKTSKLAIAGRPYRKLICENESQGLALGGSSP